MQTSANACFDQRRPSLPCAPPTRTPRARGDDGGAAVHRACPDDGVYCGDKIFKALDDHFEKIEVDGVDVTDTTQGDGEYKIVADNAEYTVTVDKTETESPATGERAPLALWIAALVVSGIVLFATAEKKKSTAESE